MRILLGVLLAVVAGVSAYKGVVTLKKLRDPKPGELIMIIIYFTYVCLFFTSLGGLYLLFRF